MNIVILGAGKIGSYVANILSKEEHDVTLIDKDPKILEQIGRDADIATLQSDGPSWQLLEDLKETHPDVFFAATGHDELNLVCCSIAKNLGFPKTIARVKSKAYFEHPSLDFGHLFHVDHFVGAELLAAQDLFNALIHSSDIAVEHFAHGAIQMRTIKVPIKWEKKEKTIQELSLPENLIIVSILRKDENNNEHVIVPHGKDHILPGDEISVVGEAEIMNQLDSLFYLTKRPVKNAILFGGTLISEYLAEFLLKQKVNVRIVDYDYSRCEALADKLPLATIINRDGRDLSLLKGERVKEADVALSCTYHDGTNMLIAAIAKQAGCPKAIALIANPSFTLILDKVDVIPALSAQVSLTNRLLTILHEDTILSVGSLCNDEAKIIELKVSPSSKSIGVPLAELSLPSELLIAVIQSEGKVMVGKGNRVLSPNDTVIVICPPALIPQLPGIFHS